MLNANVNTLARSNESNIPDTALLPNSHSSLLINDYVIEPPFTPCGEILHVTMELSMRLTFQCITPNKVLSVGNAGYEDVKPLLFLRARGRKGRKGPKLSVINVYVPGREMRVNYIKYEMPVQTVLTVLGGPAARSKHSRLAPDPYGTKMAGFPEKLNWQENG